VPCPWQISAGRHEQLVHPPGGVAQKGAGVVHLTVSQQPYGAASVMHTALALAHPAPVVTATQR
jgi:hypothetical protein